MAKIDIKKLNQQIAKLDAATKKLAEEKKEVDADLVKTDKITKDIEQIPG